MHQFAQQVLLNRNPSIGGEKDTLTTPAHFTQESHFRFPSSEGAFLLHLLNGRLVRENGLQLKETCVIRAHTQLLLFMPNTFNERQWNNKQNVTATLGRKQFCIPKSTDCYTKLLMQQFHILRKGKF